MTFEEKKITKDVADRLGVKFSDIMGRCRRWDYVQARWFVWYALILRGYTYTNVAKTFSVHHTAVSHAVQSLRLRIAINDRPTMKDVARLIHILDTARQRFAVKHGRLQVRQEPAAGLVVGMADIVSGQHALACDGAAARHITRSMNS